MDIDWTALARCNAGDIFTDVYDFQYEVVRVDRGNGMPVVYFPAFVCDCNTEQVLFRGNSYHAPSAVLRPFLMKICQHSFVWNGGRRRYCATCNHEQEFINMDWVG